jgi:adenylate cyclase
MSNGRSRSIRTSSDIASFASFVFSFSGLPEEAIAQVEKAMRLSPHFPANYLGQQGHAYRVASRMEEAAAAFKAYAERQPGFGHADLAIIYQQQGRTEEARAEIAKLRAARPNFTLRAFAGTQFFRDAAQLEADLSALRAAGLPE